LWQREMKLAVYDPRWLDAQTPQGPVRALAFTLSRKSPSHTGELTEEQYRAIFALASGIYGTTFDYAHRTLEELKRHDIRDRNLERLLRMIRKDHEKT
jgi:cation transport protein ChaC